MVPRNELLMSLRNTTVHSVCYSLYGVYPIYGIYFNYSPSYQRHWLVIKSHWIVFVTLKRTGNHWNMLIMEHYIIALILLRRVSLCLCVCV